MCASLALNGITNVKAIHGAVGSQIGQVQLPAIDINQPQNYGAVSILSESSTGEIVPIRTIDSLPLTSCHLIKIDVEGMDYEVLLGAAQTVAQMRPYIYMEAKTGLNTQKAIQWLQERNYQCYWHFAIWFDPNNYRGITENVFVNYLATPTSKNYTEVGYGIDGILRIFRLEGAVAFQDGKYLDYGFRLGIATSISVRFND